MEKAALVFSKNKTERAAAAQARAAEEEKELLQKKVGQLTVEQDFLKKNIESLLVGSTTQITTNSGLSIKRQCELLHINRWSVYYTPKTPTSEQIEREEHIKARLDFWHTKQCCLGVQGLRDKLRKEDTIVGDIKGLTEHGNNKNKELIN